MRLRIARRGRVTRKDRLLAAAMARELAGDGTAEQAANLAGWLDHMAVQLPDDPRNAHVRILASAMYEAWAERVVREQDADLAASTEDGWSR